MVGVWAFTYFFILLIAKLETGLLYKLAGSCPRFFPSWCCPFFFFFVKNGEFIKNKIKKVTGDFQSLKPLLFPFSLQLELGDRCRNIEAQKNIPIWEFYLLCCTIPQLDLSTSKRIHAYIQFEKKKGGQSVIYKAWSRKVMYFFFPFLIFLQLSLTVYYFYVHR